jgi:iron(III) transport system substrate-binding protein
VIYPQDGTIPQMEGVAIIKGGPNTENAKLFADYVARKDVREKILGFAFRRAARQDLDLAKLPGVMPQLTSLKLLTYDEDRWVEKRAETAQKLQDLIRSTR